MKNVLDFMVERLLEALVTLGGMALAFVALILVIYVS